MELSSPTVRHRMSAAMPHTPDPMPPCTLEMATIANFSDATMSRFTRDELIQLIEAAAAQVRLPSPPDIRRMQLGDTATLRRLAHLARFACRNRSRRESLNGRP